MLLFNIEQEVLLGNINPVKDNLPYLNDTVDFILKKENMDENDIRVLRSVINIFNIIYNNSPIEDVLIDDGIYDMLVTKLMNTTGETVPGAPLVDFKDDVGALEKDDAPFCPVTFYSKEERAKKTEFYGELFGNDTSNDRFNRTYGTYYPNAKDLSISPVLFNSDIARRTHTAPHGADTMVGTLDKCKFTLVKEAENAGVDLYDPKIKILERDFFAKHIKDGILDPNRQFTIIISLKYDGCSIEAKCTNSVLQAISRGDTGVGLASDMTPILKGYPFPRGLDSGDINDAFDIKFEAIMTYENLHRYNLARGKNYANCRSAINGLFTASDAWKYRDLITLVPLEINNVPKEVEEAYGDVYPGCKRLGDVSFLNSFYVNHGIPFICAIETGTYEHQLFMIKKFVEEAEYARQYMGFMYDGIVVEYADDDLREKLGKVGHVAQYSMAVKFNPLKKQTIFRGYTYSVGKDRSITPKAHYDPVEFMGTIQPNSSVHSYANFMELGLKVGDIIDVTYVNDVMAQVSKPANEHNMDNPNPVVPFIDRCPACGAPIKISDSGKAAYCTNPECCGARIAITVDMLDKLGFEGFAEESVKAIGAHSFVELMTIPAENLNLGEADTASFVAQRDHLLSRDIYDYEFMGSLGFTGVAFDKWQKILNKYTIEEIIDIEDSTVPVGSLQAIAGIGYKTSKIIADEFPLYRESIEFAIKNLHIITTKGAEKKKSIRYTGFRNQQLMEQLNSMGYDASDKSVTKNTDILLIPYAGFESTKVQKAGPNTKVIPVDDFIANMQGYLSE